MIESYFQESIDLNKRILDDGSIIDKIRVAASWIKKCFEQGNKLLIAGNGGSAADAQHLSAEFVGRYKNERRAYPAIALTTDTSILTAWSNDYGFDSVFSRQIEALGKTGDIFIGISTSGNSKNIIQGVKKCKELGISAICLLGKNGGELKDLADLAIIVPSSNTPRIQEVHTIIIHSICEEFDNNVH